MTEEREQLTIDYKDENEELKNKVNSLEHDILILSKAGKHANDSSILSEGGKYFYKTIILIYFYKIFL